eukprot:scaffold15792_cov141-Isochrysis_galbana.AAC.3
MHARERTRSSVNLGTVGGASRVIHLQSRTEEQGPLRKWLRQCWARVTATATAIIVAQEPRATPARARGSGRTPSSDWAYIEVQCNRV